ncbi:hypothetical protein D3C71_1860130 [compost metagenome]
MDNQHPAVVIADNGVLLLLNRRHDAPHLRVGFLAKHLLEQLVADGDAGVEHIVKLSVPDLVLPFQLHRSRDHPTRRIVVSRSRRVIVIHAGNGGAPIIDQEAHPVRRCKR